jgi:hypothetical protein
MKAFILHVAFTAIVATSALHAQVPNLVNYQGRVAVDAVNFEGTGQFKFALVNGDGTTTFWSNDDTSVAGSEPGAAVSLTVSKGLYSVLLGDTSLANMSAIPQSAFAEADVRLRVWFDDGVNGSQLLTPDQRIAPSGYLSDGAVTTASIADDAIVGAKIAAGTIDGTRIAPGSLDFSHLFVPAAPGVGQVLGYDGASLVWTAPGMGDGIWTIDGSLAYRIADVAIGTSTPNPGFRLAVSGNVQFVGTGNGGPMQFGSPNSETGLTIGGNGLARADLRFDGNTLKLAAGPAGFIPSTYNGIVINTAGNVGIGVLDPGSTSTKLHVADLSDSVTQVLESGGGQNAWSQLRFRNAAGEWAIGTSRDFNLNQFYISRVGGSAVQFSVETNGDAFANGNITCTKLSLRPDPAAPGNVTVQSNNAGAVNFVPYNTALNRAMNLFVWDATVRTITINGADLAEPFPMKEEAIEKGTVVVIDEEHPGRLKRSTQAYDARVAGIVSGANGVRAGIILRQEGVLDQGENVALSGRVYVKADAGYGAIRPGDMLTTSETAGHAMKASDRERASGAVLGKAMSGLEEGQGEVLVLVTLQ